MKMTIFIVGNVHTCAKELVYGIKNSVKKDNQINKRSKIFEQIAHTEVINMIKEHTERCSITGMCQNNKFSKI